MSPTDLCYAACDVDYVVRPFCFNDGCRASIDGAVARCRRSCEDVSTALFAECEALATPVFAAAAILRVEKKRERQTWAKHFSIS